MMIISLCLSLYLSLVVVAHTDDVGDYEPQQVHIALGTNETEMLITWITLKPIEDVAKVHYGLEADSLLNPIEADVSFFVHFITYRALITNLEANATYYYQVGSDASKWSQVFHFRTLPVLTDPDWMPSLAVYGDLGFENSQSMPYLQADVDQGLYDLILHVGDLAYDMDMGGDQLGHDFMNMIQPIASKVPYLTIPGNHEEKDNFSHYDARFSMIGDRHEPNWHQPLSSRISNHFWSLDIGPAHILMFASEFYFYPEYFGLENIQRQYEFIEADLRRANQRRNSNRPWIIVMGHRPYYCFRTDEDFCDTDKHARPRIREGVKAADGTLKYGLEDLFHRYGVDVQFNGHEHYYVRSWPAYNLTVFNGSTDNPYHDARAPVFLISGNAGNRETHPPYNSSDMVAFHTNDFGYTRMKFINAHHILFEQVSVDQGGQVIDRFELTKSEPRPWWLRNSSSTCLLSWILVIALPIMCLLIQLC